MPTDNVLFVSEMATAVNGIAPENGHPFDDTKRCVEAAVIADADLGKLYAGNAVRFNPWLGARFAAAGLSS